MDSTWQSRGSGPWWQSEAGVSEKLQRGGLKCTYVLSQTCGGANDTYRSKGNAWKLQKLIAMASTSRQSSKGEGKSDISWNFCPFNIKLQ